MSVLPKLRVQGLDLSGADLDWMQSWIDAHPQWSRFRLRRELCLHWNWRNASGELKTFAARSLLVKIEQQGRLRLPPIRLALRRAQPWSRQRRALDYPLTEPSPIVESLAALRPIELRVLAAGSEAERRAEAQLAHYHYRGLNRPVGPHLYYLGVDARQRELAIMLLGAAAWRCADRDRWLGWTESQRQDRLAQLVNHARFLLLPGVQVPCLASHLLGLLTAQVAQDWRRRHGVELLALETFVESGRFAGTCYQAANWQWVGRTQGRSRQDRQHRLQVGVKEVYLYGLQRHFVATRAQGSAAFNDSSTPHRTPTAAAGLGSQRHPLPRSPSGKKGTLPVRLHPAGDPLVSYLPTPQL